MLNRKKLLKGAAAIGAGLMTAVLISAAGAVLGPTSKPRPYDGRVRPETSDTSIGGDFDTTPIGTYEIETTITELELAPGVVVSARIRAPIDAGEGLPAVVFLHGAGTQDSLGFTLQAEALASAGIVSVVAEKRQDNYSVKSRDYIGSAADYHRGVDLARSLPQVDPDRVGIYAESEGAYIAPVLASEYEDVAFVVLVSAPVVPPRLQGTYAVHTYLTETHVPPDLFRLIPRALGAEFPFGWMADYLDFDPQEYQQRITQPVLVVFGTGDHSMPQAQGTSQIRADIAVAGNDAFTARFYEGANHGIRIGDGTGPLAPHFAEDLARWINGLPESATAGPEVAGAVANQPIWADPPDRPPALLSGNLLVVTHAIPPVVLLVGAGTGVAAAVRAVRRRRRGLTVEGVHRLPVLLGASGVLAVATWYIWINYVGDIAELALSYQQDPDVTFGGYRTENQVALASAFTLGVAGFHWIHGARKGARLSTLGRVAAVSTAVGTAGLLVLASYWSGFPTFGWGS
ncbi:MAG TPA: acyl-CoA thioester hydrolase/BAAT C-terminal domain-containing protein [Actinomycetaceae bacterium]|nr:acyl-CoA thioester hydrolase/BAAT C-terminal domain-containing protein [Actinomycetaceae bacterium]